MILRVHQRTTACATMRSWPGTRLTLERATTAELAAIEASWRSGRGAAEAHWRWTDIAALADETVMVIHNGADVIALWAGRTTGEVGRAAYVLDYLEVAPDTRGRKLAGPTAMLLLAHHAIATAHSSVVLAALPERVSWYLRLGAVLAVGASVPEGLVPLRFDLPVLQAMEKVLDATREKI